MAKLIVEQAEELQFIVETNEGGKKSLFIEGVYLQSGLKNRNGRIYPTEIMAKEVSRYMKEHVAQNNAFGELGHPDSPTINPDRISHLITNLRQEGNNYIGKAKVLDTPMGMIARNIIEGGGKLAVSSRGVGSLKTVGDAQHVQEDFKLFTAADIVINPSAPDAYVQGIMESKEYFFENGMLIERDVKRIQDQIDADTRARELNEQTALRAWRQMAALLSK